MEDIVKAGRKAAHIQHIVYKSRHTHQHTRSGVQKRRKRQKKGKKVLTKREIGDRIGELFRKGQRIEPWKLNNDEKEPEIFQEELKVLFNSNCGAMQVAKW